MLVRFICGCTTSEILERQNIETMDTVSFDEEGFIQCALHHQRRYGWKSLPMIAANKGNYSDFSFGPFTPLEIEGHIVFGDILPDRAVQLAK